MAVGTLTGACSTATSCRLQVPGTSGDALNAIQLSCLLAANEECLSGLTFMEMHSSLKKRC